MGDEMQFLSSYLQYKSEKTYKVTAKVVHLLLPKSCIFWILFCVLRVFLVPALLRRILLGITVSHVVMTLLLTLADTDVTPLPRAALTVTSE